MQLLSFPAHVIVPCWLDTIRPQFTSGNREVSVLCSRDEITHLAGIQSTNVNGGGTCAGRLSSLFCASLPSIPLRMTPSKIGRKTIRVLHLLGSGEPGGVETFVRTLADSLDRQSFDMSVCILGDSGIVSDQLHASGIEVTVLGSSTSRYRRLRDVFALIRRTAPDIVHLNVGGRAVRAIARLAGCRNIVVHVHGPAQTSQAALVNPSAVSSEIRRLAWAADRVIVCSRFLARLFAKELQQRNSDIITIHNGVPVLKGEAIRELRTAVRSELGIPHDAFVAGFVGRLAEQKGIPALVEAIALLRSRAPEIRVVICGDGPLSQQVREAVRPSIDLWLRGRADGGRIAAAFDVLFSTSNWEGFPIVNLEAMSAGVPVVAFDVDGISEAVIDNETGFLVPPADCAELAEKVIALSVDEPLRRRLGARAAAKVSGEFSADVMSSKVVALYGELCHGDR